MAHVSFPLLLAILAGCTRTGIVGQDEPVENEPVPISGTNRYQIKSPQEATPACDYSGEPNRVMSCRAMVATADGPKEADSVAPNVVLAWSLQGSSADAGGPPPSCSISRGGLNYECRFAQAPSDVRPVLEAHFADAPETSKVSRGLDLFGAVSGGEEGEGGVSADLGEVATVDLGAGNGVEAGATVAGENGISAGAQQGAGEGVGLNLGVGGESGLNVGLGGGDGLSLGLGGGAPAIPSDAVKTFHMLGSRFEGDTKVCLNVRTGKIEVTELSGSRGGPPAKVELNFRVVTEGGASKAGALDRKPTASQMLPGDWALIRNAVPVVTKFSRPSNNGPAPLLARQDAGDLRCLHVRESGNDRPGKATLDVEWNVSRN